MLKTTEYEVVVIGGGIQGAAVALVAKKAGYSVLLVEKNTWASATSSKSSKLIHGGLRYLQTAQFTLVAECLAEREWMLAHLPNLVSANWFYLPIYTNSHYSTWKIHCGLFLYRLLSKNNTHSSYKKIPMNKWHLLSGLQQKGLKAVFAYQDAQTDDAVLTQAIVDRAQALGVDCHEYTECISTQIQENKTYRLQLQHAAIEMPITVNAHTIINATGPWVNRVLQRLDPSVDIFPIDLVQGTHLVVSPALSDTCFYLPSIEDNRAVFCLPWKGKTLVGTTEVIHQGEPEDIRVKQQEIDYLSAVVNHYFPDYEFSIEATFCGLRVLPNSDKKFLSRPRDTFISADKNIISLYGGKLTAWRVTAKRVLYLIDEGFENKSTIDWDNLME
ncbi:MAG: glycerol-3-phosphate dehydrogenase [Candidatus Endobugula sp.]|jgi:glycerol-3-phosphate dehydrogenase